MKKLFLSICLLLCVNVLLAQQLNFTYTVRENQATVTGLANNNVTELVIPDVIPGTTTPITAINQTAFMNKSSLESVVIGNNVKKIGNYAFRNCYNLTSVTIGNSVTFIGNYAFQNCYSLTSIIIPNSVTSIGTAAFSDCSSLVSVVIGSGAQTIGANAFSFCLSLTSITFLGMSAPDFGEDVFVFGDNITSVDIPIGSIGYDVLSSLIPNSNNWKSVYKIAEGNVFTLSTPLTINENMLLKNNGILKLVQGGELIIQELSESKLGIIEVETATLTEDKWHLIGAPFAGYKLETLVPQTMELSILTFDYSNDAWSENNWATINTQVRNGECFLAYSWNTDKYLFTNYGDGIYSPHANSDYSSDNYSFSQIPAYTLNTGDVEVSSSNSNSNWLPLANPYTFKLNAATFIANQGNNIQGQVIYKLNDESYETVNSGAINVTEGFFMKLATNGNRKAIFKTTQRTQAKASVEREFVRLAMLEGEREIEVLFAQNEEANENYDIFDANKLFSPYEIAEPYFVVNNIALVKEEVNTLPYYATMNVRSFGNKEVKFKANYIPEGLSVSIIDGEETIDLSEGVEYTTNIIEGENADRFKVLIKKSLSIEEAEDLQVNIYNNNRHINIETMESDLQVEVYNALGQKVFSTKDKNFTLNQVSAGAYLIKAFNDKSSKTAKVVLR